jgi:hypothetical protein
VWNRCGNHYLSKGMAIRSLTTSKMRSPNTLIQDKAREMACEELKRRLEQLNMSASDTKGYGQLLNGVDAHIHSLHDLLEHMFLVDCNGIFLILICTLQTWWRKRKSEFGSRGRLMESWMIAV